MAVPSIAEAGISKYSHSFFGVNPNPSPQGPIVKVNAPRAITSGSELNRTAVGPWPELRDAGTQLDNAYHPNSYHDELRVKINANYAGVSSAANYQARHPLYAPGNDGQGYGSVANYPGAVPNPTRPTYNNLTAISWQQQVLTKENLNPSSYQNLSNTPTTFQPAGTAKLGVPPAPTLR